MFADVMATYDTNNDGVLSRNEFAARRSMRAEHLAQSQSSVLPGAKRRSPYKPTLRLHAETQTEAAEVGDLQQLRATVSETTDKLEGLQTQISAAATSASQQFATRVEEKVAVVQAAASDRLLRGMESWRGAFVNTVAGWFSAADTPRAASGRPESSGESAAQAAEARAGVGGAAGSRGAAAAQADPAATDGVGQISSVVADLRAQADQMNAQLRGGRSGPGATPRRPGLGLASSQLV